MLRWEETKDWEEAYSGSLFVGLVCYPKYGGPYFWTFHIGEERIDGGRGNYEDAKRDLEAAFTAWLQSAKLVHLPDGHAIVPIQPTDAMMSAGDYECMRSELPTSNMWRAMLAAANSEGGEDDQEGL